MAPPPEPPEGRLPLAEGPREALRLAYYEREVIRAVQRAGRAGCSLRCEWGDHRNPLRPGAGCLNDGTSCLCRCHDRKLPAP